MKAVVYGYRRKPYREQLRSYQLPLRISALNQHLAMNRQLDCARISAHGGNPEMAA
jgi:hypothetical protein